MSDFQARRTMMVDTQVRPSDVTKFPIIDAMLSVPREAYVPRTQMEVAYISENVDLGNGRWLLEPRTFAKMLDALAIGADDLVLDVGCGFGYSSAVLAHMAQAVVSVEDEAFADEAQNTLAEHGVDNAVVVTGALSNGAAKHGPYDAIMVQVGVQSMPEGLLDQLKDGGRIAVLFMDGALGAVRIGRKEGGTVTWRFAFNAAVAVADGFQAAEEFQL
ncbi:protein-L-isoaspartate O-methyltransferase family protein [Algirhabdus cladophorae]|uniref:protein-L-isoaspartate O-methyltransferase family protein n=1 Tax=Algirhabdus cladophorae TaxID=3377108 RepID=UPI003B849321